MDLKLDNLMVDKDFNLKLIDFDLGYYPDSSSLTGRGSKHYRAPELQDQPRRRSQRNNNSSQKLNPFKCDIFSLGVLFFVLKTTNTLPFRETQNGNKLYQQFCLNPKMFWATHVH